MTNNRVPALAIAVLALILAGSQVAQAAGGSRNVIRTDTPKNTLETARFFLKQARYAKAIVYYDIILTQFKDSNREAAWALYEKSYCLFKMKKISLALLGFRSIARLYPDETGPVTLAEKMIAKIELKYGKEVP